MIEFAARVISAELGETHLFYVGQAGYILKSSNGQLLGIDLYLSDCVERIEGHCGFKRLLPHILSPYELEFTGIIATHPHFDHFDMDALPWIMANQNTWLYASVNCEDEVKRLHLSKEHIVYVSSGEVYKMGDYTLMFVSCDHGTAAPDAVGVIISVDGKRIFMTGDTCLRLDRITEYTKQGHINLLIAPINGAFGNMDEEDCAKLSKAIKPSLTIPSHYGMFASHGGNVGLFLKKMQQICPENKYFIMAYGERITI